MPKVRFLSEGVTAHASAGMTLHEAVRGAGHVIDYACGGNALCGTCHVRVISGASLLAPPEQAELLRLAELARRPSSRLACQARLIDAEGEVTFVVA
ncbi:MAG TPA: 2Fe-2S iron-sulfur cluster-binding protein [Candidatus Polarisedimenticolia bacterium]|nr:2Fe-2S iron-sulfur cluster-binding protein [Candidatus Polarisedimenticolia bacterium]